MFCFPRPIYTPFKATLFELFSLSVFFFIGFLCTAINILFGRGCGWCGGMLHIGWIGLFLLDGWRGDFILNRRTFHLEYVTKVYTSAWRSTTKGIFSLRFVVFKFRLCCESLRSVWLINISTNCPQHESIIAIKSYYIININKINNRSSLHVLQLRVKFWKN